MTRGVSKTAGLAASSLMAAMAGAASAQVPIGDRSEPRVMEGFPSDVRRSIDAHDRKVEAASQKLFSAPNYLYATVHRRWRPGQTITVAFKGGSPELYAMIEDAARTWTAPGVANVTFQFKNTAGLYNTWSTSDLAYAAHIRISFDERGYWSHVGTDSVDKSLKGGRANEPSMNYSGFDEQPPWDWRAIVIHEFGHALGFEHEHQSPAGGCDFRFENDPGYVLTLNAREQAVNDLQGRRPGVYTIFGAKPNEWGRTQTDDNLRAIPTSSAYVIGPFDRLSIMKYFFEPWMFVGGPASPCYTEQEAEGLSDGDTAGARAAYPADPGAVMRVANQLDQVLRELQGTRGVAASLRAGASDRLEAVAK